MKSFLKTLFIALLFHSTVFAQDYYTLEKMNSMINTDYDEITPVLSTDGKTIFFTRVGCAVFDKTLKIDNQDQALLLPDHQFWALLGNIYGRLGSREGSHPANSSFNQDVWIANEEEGDFEKVEHPNYPLNNALPNSICSVTPEANEYIIINQFPKEGGMNPGFSKIKYLEDGSWGEPEPILVNNFYTKQAGVSITMSSDGNVLILSLDRHDSFGNNDLYVSFKEEDDKWSEPVNLGLKVNSSDRETTPHLSTDTKRLFFSSNRNGSMGGNDIYMVERLDDTWTNWSLPRRFVAPINSRADDSQPYFNQVTGYLYFTSKRSGNSDIYRVKIAPAMPDEVEVSGRLVDANNQPVDAEILYSDTGDAFLKNITYSKNGYFNFNVPRGKEVKVVAKKDGYISYATTVKADKPKKLIETNLMIDKLEIDGKISLKPIYFQQSEAIILDKSFPAIKELADVLKMYKDISIRIEGHTDANGKDADLKKLSYERAEAVKNYLIEQNIDPKRVETVGMGGTRPINDNSTEEKRQRNRRVEVRITKVGKSGKGS